MFMCLLHLNYVNPIQDRSYHTMIKLGTFTPYLQKDQKYMNHVIHIFLVLL